MSSIQVFLKTPLWSAEHLDAERLSIKLNVKITSMKKRVFLKASGTFK